MEDNYTNMKKYSVFETLLWVFFLTFGLQTILGFIAVAGIHFYGVEQNEIERVLTQPDSIAIIGIVAALLSLPLIKKASYSSGKSFPHTFLAFQPIKKHTLFKVLLIGIIYYIFEFSVTSALSIKTPEFLLEVKSLTNSPFDVFMLIIGVCIVAPIIEEIVFRGLAYARLENSRVGISGAIIITSIIFTIIHTQYEPSLLIIFSLFSFLLGYVRYKTGNILYCIVLHMQLNIFSTLHLFFFL